MPATRREQLRWPRGTPGGLGGQWRPEGMSDRVTAMFLGAARLLDEATIGRTGSRDRGRQMIREANHAAGEIDWANLPGTGGEGRMARIIRSSIVRPLIRDHDIPTANSLRSPSARGTDFSSINVDSLIDAHRGSEENIDLNGARASAADAQAGDILEHPNGERGPGRITQVRGQFITMRFEGAGYRTRWRRSRVQQMIDDQGAILRPPREGERVPQHPARGPSGHVRPLRGMGPTRLAEVRDRAHAFNEQHPEHQDREADIRLQQAMRSRGVPPEVGSGTGQAERDAGGTIRSPRTIRAGDRITMPGNDSGVVGPGTIESTSASVVRVTWENGGGTGVWDRTEFVGRMELPESSPSHFRVTSPSTAPSVERSSASEVREGDVVTYRPRVSGPPRHGTIESVLPSGTVRVRWEGASMNEWNRRDLEDRLHGHWTITGPPAPEPPRHPAMSPNGRVRNMLRMTPETMRQTRQDVVQHYAHGHPRNSRADAFLNRALRRHNMEPLQPHETTNAGSGEHHEPTPPRQPVQLPGQNPTSGARLIESGTAGEGDALRVSIDQNGIWLRLHYNQGGSTIAAGPFANREDAVNHANQVASQYGLQRREDDPDLQRHSGPSMPSGIRARVADRPHDTSRLPPVPGSASAAPSRGPSGRASNAVARGFDDHRQLADYLVALANSQMPAGQSSGITAEHRQRYSRLLNPHGETIAYVNADRRHPNRITFRMGADQDIQNVGPALPIYRAGITNRTFRPGSTRQISHPIGSTSQQQAAQGHAILMAATDIPRFEPEDREGGAAAAGTGTGVGFTGAGEDPAIRTRRETWPASVPGQAIENDGGRPMPIPDDGTLAGRTFSMEDEFIPNQTGTEFVRRLREDLGFPAADYYDGYASSESHHFGPDSLGQWVTTRDTTAGMDSIEVASSPLVGEEGFNRIREQLAMIREHGGRQGRQANAGIHFHIGVKDMSRSEIEAVGQTYKKNRRWIHELIAPPRRGPHTYHGSEGVVGTSSHYVEVNLPREGARRQTIEFRKLGSSVSGDTAISWGYLVRALVQATKDNGGSLPTYASLEELMNALPLTEAQKILIRQRAEHVSSQQNADVFPAARR